MPALAITRVTNVWRRSWKRSRSVEVPAELTGEDHVVLGGPPVAPSQTGERLGDIGREWDRAKLAALRRRNLAQGIARASADRRAGEVDVAPPQRQQLAPAQSGERGGQVDRAVLLTSRRTHERPHLFRSEHVDIELTALT